MLDKEYASKDLIPEGYAHLYVESGGKFVLKSVTQVKSENDVKNVQEALRKEREEHTETKTKLGAFGDLDPVETQEKLDSIPALEAAAGSGDNEQKIQAGVDARLNTIKTQHDREVKKLTDERDKASNERDGLLVEQNDSLIETWIKDAGIAAKMTEGGIDDALARKGNFEVVENAEGKKCVQTKDTALSPELWLTDIKETKGHWWPPSVGGGSSGSNNGAGASGKNPWTYENWNVTEQMTIQSQKGDDTARKMAESAGSSIAGARPAPPSN